jgi:hypothetical protein
VLTQIGRLDAILDRYAAVIGADIEAYRNHAYRVANLCAASAPRSPDMVEKIAVASAFHDLGIWTDRTFDYLEPSVRLAREYLIVEGRGDWVPEVTAAIREHHRITRGDGVHGPLVEPFRRADWIDVSGGLLAFGSTRTLFRAAVARWPRAGFHRLLARLELRQLRTHPWHPLPMLKL